MIETRADAAGQAMPLRRWSGRQGPHGARRDGQMSEIDDIRGRVEAAFERIGRSLDLLQPIPTEVEERIDPAVVVALKAEIADEKVVQAQLEERIRSLKARHEEKVAELEAQIVAQRGQLAALDADLQRLRQSNADLRDMAGQLRAALSDEVAEPELVNRAMLAEIEALRATRDADLAEITAVLDELKPLVEEAK